MHLPQRWIQWLKELNTPEVTVISFILVALLGATLLWHTEKNRWTHNQLPQAEKTLITQESIESETEAQIYEETHTYLVVQEQKGESFLNMLFMSVSALCVAGLTVVDFSQFTPAGQWITLGLIQMGGIGIIFFTSVLAYFLTRGISEGAVFKSLLAEVLDTQHHAIEHMIKHILQYTLFFEITGTLLLRLHFHLHPSATVALDGLNPWWFSFFHSVASFNNSGFSLLPNSLENFESDPILLLTTLGLMGLGGLGYPLLIGIHAGLKKRWTSKHINEIEEDARDVATSPVQNKIALWGALILIGIGTALTVLIEWGKNENMDSATRFLNLLFQTVAAGTSGFNSMAIGEFQIATLVLFMVLMFIGANPGGTAGGIKIPTVAVLYAYVKDWFGKPGQPLKLFHSVISKFALSHAIRLLLFSLTILASIIFLICFFEAPYLKNPDRLFNFTKITFEVISAFGTSGLSMGFEGGTTSFSTLLSEPSKGLIILTMFLGRLGGLTILAALPWKRKYSKAPPSEDHPNAQKIQIG